MKKTNRIYVFAIWIGVFLLMLMMFWIVRRNPGTVEEVEKIKRNDSVFSWDETTIHGIKRVQLEVVMENMQAGRLFQTFNEKSFASETMKEFMGQMQESGIAVYYLAGDAKWALDGGIEIMQQEIDKVSDWNNGTENNGTENNGTENNGTENNGTENNGKFAGIILDVEPYLNEEWGEDEQGSFEQFVERMKNVYTYSKEKNVKMLLCIPYWYDKVNESVLEDLIANACDETAVMNYYRGKEYKNIKTELELAKKYKKEITCIFEFIQAGKHELKEINTYNKEGVEKALDSMQQLKEEVEYDKFYGSYHYLKPLIEIMVGEEY